MIDIVLKNVLAVNILHEMTLSIMQYFNALFARDTGAMISLLQGVLALLVNAAAQYCKYSSDGGL